MAIQDDIICSLEKKIKQIILVAEELRINNLELKQQVTELSETVRKKDIEMAELNTQYQNLRLTKTMISSPEDVRHVKLQVNRMLREIDKCIALLNR